MIILPLRLRLTRHYYSDKITLGRVECVDKDNEFICYSMELSKYGHPSCIPEGLYRVRSYVSPRLKNLGWTDARATVWQLDNVKGRSNIQIHTANYPSELKGCIAVGLSVSKNKDGIFDSRKAFDLLTSKIGGFNNVWELEVTSEKL